MKMIHKLDSSTFKKIDLMQSSVDGFISKNIQLVLKHIPVNAALDSESQNCYETSHSS